MLTIRLKHWGATGIIHTRPMMAWSDITEISEISVEPGQKADSENMHGPKDTWYKEGLKKIDTKYDNKN